jgi:hypothetical protein
MNDNSEYTGRLSARATKKLFFNAEDDPTTQSIFQGLQEARVVAKQEVRPVEKPVNPFAAIEERNAELDRIRHEMALRSDETQVLVKEPPKQADTSKLVTLEELPLAVKQAAEAAMLKNFRKSRR